MLQDLHDRGIYLTEDEYKIGLRTLFSEDYQEFSDEELEDVIYDRIAQLSPAEAESLIEGFGSWLKKAASKALPVVTAALPIVTGAVGTAFGGPLGGAAAGMAGNFAAGAISKATKTKPNQFVSNVGQAASSIAGGKAAGIVGSNGAKLLNQTQAPAKLLSFIKSTPLLQSLLSSIVTGNIGTGLQIPKEDGSATSTNYIEMLEALKRLTENAIIAADDAGFSSNLQIESESEGEAYIESVIEDVSNYENSLLPNYDVITY